MKHYLIAHDLGISGDKATLCELDGRLLNSVTHAYPTHFFHGNWSYIADEMRRIVAACRERGVTSKVIFENCYLTDDEKKHLRDVPLAERPDFIKTSNGFGTPPAGAPVGATVADVRLMKACVGDSLRIKAAGDIRTVEDALSMIDAGANRIGTSRGVAVVEGYRAMLAAL